MVAAKPGKQSQDLAWFYSSLQKQPVVGLYFLNLDLINNESRQLPLLVIKQFVREVT